MNSYKIAIVGPEESKWNPKQIFQAKQEIFSILLANDKNYDVATLVSGRCHKGGVDIWAEGIAKNLEIQTEIYPAEVHQWTDEIDIDGIKWKGFRSRNIQIAEACDILYCIVPKTSGKIYCKHCNALGHPTNGGCWTMRHAAMLGKKTELIIIE